MTQAEQILAHLETGASITPLEALNEYGCFRLGARIFDLKKDGHAIVSDRKTLPNGKTIAEYTLKKEDAQ